MSADRKQAARRRKIIDKIALMYQQGDDKLNLQLVDNDFIAMDIGNNISVFIYYTSYDQLFTITIHQSEPTPYMYDKWTVSEEKIKDFQIFRDIIEHGKKAKEIKNQAISLEIEKYIDDLVGNN